MTQGVQLDQTGISVTVKFEPNQTWVSQTGKNSSQAKDLFALKSRVHLPPLLERAKIPFQECHSDSSMIVEIPASYLRRFFREVVRNIQCNGERVFKGPIIWVDANEFCMKAWKQSAQKKKK